MKKDSVDHINIYTKGKTRLGRSLSNMADIPVSHYEFGDFKCIEGLWYWLGCRDDRLRKTDGFSSKQLGRNIGASDWLNYPQHKEIIKEALVLRFKQNKWLEDMLLESTLPFAHYYVYGEKKVKIPQAKWVVDFISDYRLIKKTYIMVD